MEYRLVNESKSIFILRKKKEEKIENNGKNKRTIEFIVQ